MSTTTTTRRRRRSERLKRRYEDNEYEKEERKESYEDSIEFVTYNVLSSSLCSPGYYTKCSPDDLNPDTRLRRAYEKLTPHVRQGAVIGLQEISLTWSTRMRLWFRERGYEYIVSNYGNRYNDYMGVGLAFPIDRFDLSDVKVACPMNEPKWARPPKHDTGGSWLRTAASALVLYPLWGPVVEKVKQIDWCNRKKTRSREAAKNPLEQCKRRFNRIVGVKLSDKRTGVSFAVCVYHMPCVFWDQAMMTIHAALMAQSAQTFAEDLPLILMGDFNFGPDSDPYRLLLGDRPDTIVQPPIPEYESWRPRPLRSFRSAYVDVEGREPSYTNYTHSGKPPMTFRGTLDYILYDDGASADGKWRPIDVVDLPEFDPSTTELMPNRYEPSDHLLIGASFRLM